MRHRSIRTGLILLLALVVALSHAQDDQTLRVAVASWMLEKTPIEAAAEEFEADHPGVDVVVETLASEFDTSLIPALQTDAPPYDVLMPYSGGDAAPFAELGLLASWDGVFGNPDYQVNGHELSRDDFIQGFLQQSEYDGEILSMPVFGEVMALTFRRDMLDEEGVAVPTSWEEIEQACIALADPFRAGFAAELSRGRNTIVSMFGIALSNGGSVLDEEGRFNLLAPETVAALEYLVGLNAEHECAQSNAVNQWDAARTNYLRGNVAQFYAWASWGSQAILPDEEIFGEGSVTIVSPPGAAEHGTILYAGGAIVPETGNVELAQRFVVEKVLSMDFQQWYASNYGKSPVLAENYEGLPEDLWGQLEGMTTVGTSMPSFLNYTEMTNIFQKHFNRAWSGEITAREALEATQEEIAPLY